MFYLRREFRVRLDAMAAPAAVAQPAASAEVL
jgi:hypothetical protein